MCAVAVENVGFYRNFEYQRGRRECAFFKSVTYLRYDFGRLRFACGKIYADGKILKACVLYLLAEFALALHYPAVYDVG